MVFSARKLCGLSAYVHILCTRSCEKQERHYYLYFGRHRAASGFASAAVCLWQTRPCASLARVMLQVTLPSLRE